MTDKHGSAEKTVRDIRRATRRKSSAEEKMLHVLRAEVGQNPPVVVR